MLALSSCFVCALFVVASHALQLGTRIVPNPSLPLKLGACAIGCIANLLRDAETKYGCTDLSPTCICKSEHRDFFYGIRDCSLQACGPVISQKVTDWYYDGLGCDRTPSITPLSHVSASKDPAAANKSPTAYAAASSWIIPSILPSILTAPTSSAETEPRYTPMGSVSADEVSYPPSELPAVQTPTPSQETGVLAQDPFALTPPPDVDADGLGSVGAEWLDGPAPEPVPPVPPPVTGSMKY